jgi:hypothetical protein
MAPLAKKATQVGWPGAPAKAAKLQLVHTGAANAGRLQRHPDELDAAESIPAEQGNA